MRGCRAGSGFLLVVVLMHDSPRVSPPESEQPEADSFPKAPQRDAWRSEELLGNRPEVLILHNNEVYRLRRTRQGKLILHK